MGKYHSSKYLQDYQGPREQFMDEMQEEASKGACSTSSFQDLLVTL